MELYSQILDNGGSSFGAILRHVRDNPTEGCLVHCTAGKDRTGVISAILLKVCPPTYRSILLLYLAYCPARWCRRRFSCK